jgi:hypothetical protein
VVYPHLFPTGDCPRRHFHPCCRHHFVHCHRLKGYYPTVKAGSNSVWSFLDLVNLDGRTLNEKEVNKLELRDVKALWFPE